MAARGLLPRLQGVDITGDLTLQIFGAILAADTGDGQLGQGEAGRLGRKNRWLQAHDGIPERKYVSCMVKT